MGHPRRLNHGLFVLALVLLVCDALSFPCWAAEDDLLLLAGTSAQRVRVLHQPRLETTARDIARDAEEILREVERRLGWPPAGPIEVVLLNDSALFARLMPGGDRFTGFASARDARIVLDVKKLAGSPFGLDETLRHELIHIVLGRGIPRANLPRWLNEGVAQWLSGGVTELMQTGKADALRKAALTGHLIPFGRIQRSFPEEPDLLTLAYAQSLAFVRYLEQRGGEESVLGFLDDLRGGQSLRRAVRHRFGEDFSSVEAGWRDYMRVRSSWVGYLAERIYWILFLGASLLTVCGFVRLRRRMRRIQEEWEEEERMAAEERTGPGSMGPA